MLHSIIGRIICSEFEHTFGRGALALGDRSSDLHNAMEVKFSLHPDFTKEEGYRHLTLLIYGDGTNYIGVYAKLDWVVIANENVIGDDNIKGEYTKGETPWVLIGYHDSCWRDAVERTLWDYRDRLSTIGTLFTGVHGWYRSIPVDDAFRKELEGIRQDTPGYGNSRGERVKLEDLDFQFPEPAPALLVEEV